MFRRRWKWFGELVSDEGFSLAYGNKTITYKDPRGSWQFGLEDGFLFSNPRQVDGVPIVLSAAELSSIVARIVEGVRSEGHAIEVYSKRAGGQGAGGTI